SRSSGFGPAGRALATSRRAFVKRSRACGRLSCVVVDGVDGQTDERRGDRGVVSRAAGATALVHPSRDTVTLMRRLVVLFALLLSCRSPQGTDAGLAATRPPASSPLDAAPGPAEDLPEAPRDPREAAIASAATELLKEHLLGRPIDDSISKEAFQRLVEDLDSAKVFLLASDVEKLARFEADLDDELRAGDLVLGRKASALLASRRRVVGDIIAG